MTRDRVMAGIVFLVALALRVSVIAELQPLPLFRTPQLDSLEYLEWAERYAAGDFSWPARPSHGPGYPMFLGAILAATGSLAAARVVQAVVGALTCVLVYSIALRSFGRRAATAAGLLAAAYAPLILADVSILAEGLLVFLLAAALRLSQSERWTAIGAAGLALGSAAIVRPTALAVLPLVLWAVWRARPSPKALALFLAAVAYPLAPAMLHTWRETGQIVLVQAGGGMNTYIGNSPKHDGTAWARPGGEWDALQGAAWRAGLVKPAEEDSFYLRQLRREIVEEPLGFARVLASKAMWLIQDEEVRDSHSFHFFAAESAVLRWTLRFGVLLALAVAGVVVAPRRDLVLPVYLLIMALTVVALVAGSRYRLPVVLPLFVYGGVAIVGSLVGRDYGELLGQMSDAMSELGRLHRETERQQQEIERRARAELRLSRQLDESGRGIQVLYAELDQQSESLRWAATSRTRFLAGASHELRTPINSILGLARLLLAHTDGQLTAEQQKQVGFIKASAESLGELVDDLLDLAKMDAGRVSVRPDLFEVDALFGTLRGMLRPLATNADVALEFDDTAGLPELDNDEGKIAQVLRNLVSNALKFTERGEVRVGARRGDGDTIVFTVADTGIGIPPEDRERVFEEFIQLDSPIQRRVKGTGLGLTVSRRLAEALGGTLEVASAVGRGSTFTLTVPRLHPEAAEMERLRERSRDLDPALSPVLVVEDDRQTLFLYERLLADAGFQVLPARSTDEARAVLTRLRPSAIVLDVVLEGETTWGFLTDLKADPVTRDIPTLVVTVVDREQKARALGADEFCIKPMEQEWLLRKLRAMAAQRPLERLLVIDDDDVARYVVRRMLADTPYVVFEAADGPTGVRIAREQRPDVILLDFVLADMTAFEVLDDLKADPATRTIPVIINTSKDLGDDERRRLAADTAAILSKQTLSREVAIGRIREALAKAVAAPDAGRAGAGAT